MSNEARAAVVTGSSSGIGLAIAQALLAQGWQVQGIDRAPPPFQHAAYRHAAFDLCDAMTLDAALPGLRSADALVHAAGVLLTARLGELDIGAGESMWRLHVDVATRLANALLPAMATRGFGRAVLVGSRVARGSPGRSQYAATKSALVALARSWAMELAPAGVTVNVVSPAATRTPMLQDPARESVTPQVPPIGRLIEPAEVAALVAFLLSPAAAAITGQEIQVCGGASLGT